MLKTSNRIYVAIFLTGLSPSAFAYLDPGTGSVIIQGLVAAVAMAGVTARMYWHKLKRMLGMSSQTEEPELDAPEAENKNS